MTEENKKYTIDYLNSIVKVLENNEVYRISDVSRFDINHKVCKEIMTNSCYDNTILREFLQKTNRLTVNAKQDLLYNIMIQYKEKKKITGYDETYLVIHIRSGDNYERAGLGNPNHHKSLINTTKTYISTNPTIKKIVIVTALHYGVSKNSKIYPNTKTYIFDEKSKQGNLAQLHNFIQQCPLDVEVVSNIDIDYDFCILCTAKHLLTIQGSGFSNLSKTFNKKYNQC